MWEWVGGVTKGLPSGGIRFCRFLHFLIWGDLRRRVRRENWSRDYLFYLILEGSIFWLKGKTDKNYGVFEIQVHPKSSLKHAYYIKIIQGLKENII